MLKRKYVFTALLIIIVLSIIAYYITNLLITTQEESDRLKKEILSQVEDIKTVVTAIRKLEFPRDMKIVVISREQALKWWSPGKPTEKLTYEETVYKLTLLVPETFNLTAAVGEWTASFLAATAGYTIYIIKENFNATEEDVRMRTIAHELVHVLQYHYFKVEYPEYLDGKLAVRAIVEGDADFTADIYCNETGIPPRSKLAIPIHQPYFALKLFPYIYGERFIAYLYRVGNWSLVNKVYANLPESTEQIMHPEKYLRGEKPIDTILKVSVDGELKYVNVMGEYYILLILAPKVGLDEAFKATEGWGGDKLALYKTREEWILYWNITWDTQIDAEEFYNATVKALQCIGEEICVNKQIARFLVNNYQITITLCNRNTLVKAEAKIKH